MRLAERVAVVTGATSEIGTVTALLLAAKGAAVAEKLEEAGARFHAAPPALSRPEVVEGFFADVATRLGPADILGSFPWNLGIGPHAAHCPVNGTMRDVCFQVIMVVAPAPRHHNCARQSSAPRSPSR